MTEEEIKVLELIKEAWNAFLLLPEYHNDDKNEFRFHVHALQNMILARDGLRNMNGVNSQASAIKFHQIQVKIK